MCEHFRDYLFYVPHFDVYTDYNPLTYSKSSCKVNATGQRWINELTDFNFTVHYKPGVENVVADTLSRLPINGVEDLQAFSGLCSVDEVKAIFDGAVNQAQNGEAWLPKVNIINADLETELLYTGGRSRESLTTTDFSKFQNEDEVISRLIDLKNKGTTLNDAEKSKESKEVRSLLRDFEKLFISKDDGVLYRTTAERTQLVLPKKLVPLVFTELHVSMGHLGKGRTLQLIRDRFYWPKMENDVTHFATKICSCVKRKKPHIVPVVPMHTFSSAAPLELIGLDFLRLDTCSGGYQYLLVLSDHFSKFVQVYPTTNTSAKTAADRLYNDFMLRYGLPRKILHDQGREFENDLFSQLSKYCSIKRLRTTPYHPQTNGQTERMNQKILTMLKTLPEHHKTQWKNHVNKLVHAYNCTKHSSNGYSPYYLMFGRVPRLPIDLILPTRSSTTPSQSKSSYVETWKNQMKEAYQLAFQHSNERKTKDVIRRNTKRPCLTTLEPGDRVLIRNLSERRGTDKMRSCWEEQIYIIVSSIGHDPCIVTAC